jgi:hypothetical protein
MKPVNKPKSKKGGTTSIAASVSRRTIKQPPLTQSTIYNQEIHRKRKDFFDFYIEKINSFLNKNSLASISNELSKTSRIISKERFAQIKSIVDDVENTLKTRKDDFDEVFKLYTSVLNSSDNKYLAEKMYIQSRIPGFYTPPAFKKDVIDNTKTYLTFIKNKLDEQKLSIGGRSPRIIKKKVK